MSLQTSTSRSCWQIDTTSILEALVNVAKRAGEVIVTSSTQAPTTLDTKKNSADLVTETDKQVERLISSTLMVKYPSFKFLGEETYKPGMKLGNEPTFVVDPIDGTTNFVHGYPYVSISLGFAVNKEPIVGVVYNPFTGKMYTGVKGRGSFVQNWKIPAEEKKRKLPLREAESLSGLDKALVAIEFGSDRSGNNWKVKTETFRRLGASKDEGGAMVHSARALGSAALNLCAVAEGSVDAYWEGGCWAWDVCAGWIILKEAGGIIVDGNPSGKWEVEVDHRKYLAVRAAESGQKEFVEEFWGFIAGNMEYES